MTVREIARTVGKEERSVHRWITKTSDIMSEVFDKVAQAKKTQKPADYTLEETIEIIRVGLGTNAGELFRENAMNNKALQTKMLNTENLSKIIAIAVRSAIEPIIQELKQMTIKRSYKRRSPSKNLEYHDKNLKYFLKEFLRNTPISKSKNDLLRGKIFYNETYKEYYYKSKDFKIYAYNKIHLALDIMEFYRNLKALKNYTKTIKTETRRSVRVWVCPESFLLEKEINLIDHREYVSPNLL